MRDPESAVAVQTGSGIIGQPISYKGPDGKQYVAIVDGVGGWAGAIVAGGLDPRDETSALGFVGAIKDCQITRAREERSMCSRFLDVSAVLVCAVMLIGCHTTKPVNSASTKSASSKQRVLRVCSDPNNLPFSNEQREGYENRIAEVIARELHARVEYTWFAQRRGFVRNTLNNGLCDVIIGVPSGYDPVASTEPYYRSSYVFVTRADSKLQVRSLDDAALRRVKIGVHIVGDDYANTPPVHALSRRHIVQNVSGYTLYGDYSQPNPPAR